MKKYLLGILLLFILSNFYSIGVSGNALSADSTDPQAPTENYKTYFPMIRKNPAAPIVIDHTSIELFERIPEAYLTAARNTRVMFSDRSVGQNIDEALDCLTAATWGSSDASCRRDYYAVQGSNWLWTTYTQTDLDNNQVPARILFTPSATRYNRSNWTFEYRTGTWEELVENFVIQLVPSYVNSKDVLTYQFSYLNIDAGSSIDDASEGFFVDLPHFGYYPNNRERWDISDIEALESQYPNKKFIYWTTSLARGVGSIDGTNFNNQMREYAQSHNKILFDVADILSHDSRGNLCHDNRDSVQYCSANGCENHANDGLSLPAICQDYTTEIDGGHLGSVSGGKIRLAKAFWVLMARTAGWNGVP